MNPQNFRRAANAILQTGKRQSLSSNRSIARRLTGTSVIVAVPYAVKETAQQGGGSGMGGGGGARRSGIGAIATALAVWPETD
jgi:hypothetical protein